MLECTHRLLVHVVFVDMDASAAMGEQLLKKMSTAYAAPEVIRGDLTATASVDIWSFGATVSHDHRTEMLLIA